MAERGEKTGHVTISLWLHDDGSIHLTIPDHGFSTVSPNAESKRGNPHLFNKLAKVLRDQGKPHPEIVEEWERGLGN